MSHNRHNNNKSTSKTKNNCRHNSYRKCTRCVCICPRPEPCPPCPVCPDQPASFQLQAVAGQPTAYPVNEGDVLTMIAVGGGGGGASAVDLLGGGRTSSGGGGGRGRYEYRVLSVPFNGQLTYTIGNGGNSDSNGEDSVIRITYDNGSAPFELRARGGTSGKITNISVDPINGGDDGGGGGVSLFNNNVISGAGGPAGQGEPGEPGGFEVVQSYVGGDGGDGLVGVSGVNLFDTFLSNIPGQGGSGGQGVGLGPGSLGGGGGAGGVGATGKNAYLAVGGDGISPDQGGQNNPARGGTGWGAGGGGGTYYSEVYGSFGGKGAPGAIGIDLVSLTQ